jgi:pantothenate kinase-related protein Tda10
MYQPYVPYLSYDRSAASAATDVADKVTLSFICDQMSFGGWRSGFRPPAAFSFHAGASDHADFVVDDWFLFLE